MNSGAVPAVSWGGIAVSPRVPEVVPPTIEVGLTLSEGAPVGVVTTALVVITVLVVTNAVVVVARLVDVVLVEFATGAAETDRPDSTEARASRGICVNIV